LEFVQFLTLRILSPLEDLYSGEVLSVSGVNSDGPFDILPQHANFVTLVENQAITARLADGSQKVFNYPLAVVHCCKDKVDIYTDLGQAEHLLPEPKSLT
jgi:F0F1-type ATP synthase epsilon subunit